MAVVGPDAMVYVDTGVLRRNGPLWRRGLDDVLQLMHP